MTPLIVLVAVIGGLGLLTLSWRQCVFTILFLVVFEGAIRKWVLPGASELVYFVKDVVLIVAIAKYLVSEDYQQTRSPCPPLLAFFLVTSAVFCLFQTCNWNLGSPIIGIIGARNYLLYIPLMFLMQSLFRSQDEVFRFLRWYLPLSIPIFLLATRQHYNGEDSALNDYVWGGHGVAKGTIGNYVRATGTFSYIAGYCSYLLTVAALCIPLLVIELPTVWKWIFRLVLICVIAGMLLTGSRGPVIGFALFLGGYLLLNRFVLVLGLYRKFFIPAVLCALALFIWFRPQVENLANRFQTNGEMSARITSSFFRPIPAMEHSGLLGYGAGYSYQAADYIRRKMNLPAATPIDFFYESEPERVMLELGPFGFFLWYGLRILLIVLLWQTFCQMRFPFFRELALTAFLVHLVSITGQMVFQITFMVYFWFFAGFIFLLPELERLELNRWQHRQQRQNRYSEPTLPEEARA